MWLSGKKALSPFFRFCPALVSAVCLGFYQQMVFFLFLLQWLYDRPAYSKACGRRAGAFTLKNYQQPSKAGGHQLKKLSVYFSQLTLVGNDLSMTCTFVAGVYLMDQTAQEAKTCPSSSIHVCSSEYESAK